MVNAEPATGERADEGGAVLRKKQIFAQNTGNCVEDRYPEGAVLLNLGSGDIAWDGWINVDAHSDGWRQSRVKPDVVADITHLPYPENHADAIAAIHIIEHFYHWEVQGVLKEWLRVLKPGSRLILELPSMEKVFSYIADRIQRRLPLSHSFSFLPIWGDPQYRDPAMCHKWGYFFSTLKVELVKAGFTDVQVEKPRYHFPQRDMRVTAAKPNLAT